MQVALPFPFTALYGKAGQKSPARKVVASWVEGSVRQPNERDVSWVAEFYVYPDNGTPRYFEKCISYEGEIYVQARDDENEPVEFLPRSTGDRIGGSSVIKDIMGTRTLSEAEQEVMVSAMDGRQTSFRSMSVKETNLRQRQAVAETCIDSLIYFRAAFWRKIPWIGLELRQSDGVASLGVSYGKTGYDVSVGPLSPEDDLVKRFALDDVGRAISHARGQEVESRIANLHIFGPLPQIDSRRDFEIAWAGHAVRALEPIAGELDADTLAAWLFLREELGKETTNASGEREILSDAIRRSLNGVRDEALRDIGIQACSMLDAFDEEDGILERKPTATKTQFRLS